MDMDMNLEQDQKQKQDQSLDQELNLGQDQYQEGNQSQELKERDFTTIPGVVLMVIRERILLDQGLPQELREGVPITSRQVQQVVVFFYHHLK